MELVLKFEVDIQKNRSCRVLKVTLKERLVSTVVGFWHFEPQHRLLSVNNIRLTVGEDRSKRDHLSLCLDI